VLDGDIGVDVRLRRGVVDEDAIVLWRESIIQKST